jgi:hypothetical protein
LAIARITELQARALSIDAGHRSGKDKALLKGAQNNLEAADKSAKSGRNLTGAAIERTWNNIYAAEVVLLHFATNKNEIAAYGYEVLAFARQHLPNDDLNRLALENILEPQPAPVKLTPLDAANKEIAVHALKAAQMASTIEKLQARSFRNTVYVGTVMLFILAAALAVLGMTMPEKASLCFPSPPTLSTISTICPTGGARAGGYDILLVEIIGVTAAGLTGAVSISRLQGTATPYMIPLALILLKLPAGAVSAVLGLILISAGLIPGLGNLTSQAQVLAWAALFGAGQQAVTHFVDAKGQEVLNSVRMRGLSSGQPPQPPQAQV